jgi:uncharacterized protein YndB with AHSA1/START domain
MRQRKETPVLPVKPGLCGECLHAAVKGTHRGTAYLRCTRASWDDRLVRYPSLPVTGCAGFERAAPYDGAMDAEQDAPRVVRASREIAASPERIFELIADPAQQPRWDGNDNLGEAQPGQRVREAGDVFRMTLTNGSVRENHVVEFEEGRRIAWCPSEVGRRQPGHRWRWELEPLGESRTMVTHTYDWTRLADRNRLPRARSITPDRLLASLDRLAEIAESPS